ncbi:MAG: hypothetical protein Q8T11_11195 [Elusimicrobiota bacterium]|nr:hypothetical protein [Elusimicrobiota bacterium]
MGKTMIFSALMILSTIGGISTHAQNAAETAISDRKEAVDIMLRLGELQRRKSELGDPKKDLVEGLARIMFSKSFSRQMSDNARKMAAQFGGDLGDKFLQDAEAIEADADAKAKQEGDELNARVGSKIKRASEMGSEIKALEDRFWATQYGQMSDAAWTAQAKEDKAMYAIHCASGRDGLLRWNAVLMHSVSRALEKTANGRPTSVGTFDP